MKTDKTIGIVFSILMGMIICGGFVYGLGITPGRTVLDYEEGKELVRSVPFTVINSEQKDKMDVAFEIVGEPELIKYVTLNQNGNIIKNNSWVTFSKSEGTKEFTYDVNLPANFIFEKKGLHEVNIIAKELPPGVTGGDQLIIPNIGAVVAVVTQIHINVPINGPYAEAKLTIAGGEDNGPVKFYIEVANLGTEDLETEAMVRITGPNEFNLELPTDKKLVKQRTKEELSAVWNPDVNVPSGIYKANVELKYNGKIKTIEKEFKFRDLMIDILSITSEDFKLGLPAKFDINVKSNWSELMEGIYVQTIINQQKDIKSEIANFDSAPFSVEGYGFNSTVAWWDTKGTQEGVYGGRMILHYNSRISQKMISSVRITPTSFDASLTGAVVGGGSGGGFKLSNFLIFLLVVLVVLNIAWFVYFNRKIKKK